MPKNFYPTMIICLLGTFVLFLIWSAFQASTQGTQVTDLDYYSKGLKYNSTQVEKRAAASLGWKLQTELLHGQLQIRLQDGNDQAVRGANGQLTLYSRPGVDLLRLQLSEIEAGHYQTDFPAELKGEVTLRIDFERDGARINRQLLITI